MLMIYVGNCLVNKITPKKNDNVEAGIKALRGAGFKVMDTENPSSFVNDLFNFDKH